MQRKPALAIAGAITSTVIAGALAVAANLGVIGSRGIDPVGNESPIGALEQQKPKVVTVIVDVTPKPKVETVVVNDTSGGASTAGSAQNSGGSFESEGADDEGDDEAEFGDDHGDDDAEDGDRSDEDGAEDDGSDHEGIDDDD